MTLGPLGRLGRWTATHFRAVALAWLVVAVGLGIFAPRVEHALSGAGWEATGSESVTARNQIDAKFGGQSSYALQAVVHSDTVVLGDPAFDRTVRRTEAVLAGSDAVSGVVPPRRGSTVSADGHTAVV